MQKKATTILFMAAALIAVALVAAVRDLLTGP